MYTFTKVEVYRIQMVMVEFGISDEWKWPIFEKKYKLCILFLYLIKMESDDFVKVVFL